MDKGMRLEIVISAAYGVVATGGSTAAFRGCLPKDRFASLSGRTTAVVNYRSGSIAVADDLSKVPEIRAKGASSKFLQTVRKLGGV